MVYGRGYIQGAVKLAQTAGAFASGRSYIQRYFPPGYREPATKLVTAFEQAAAGAGLYQIITSWSTDNAVQKTQQPNAPSPFDQTYRRQPTGSSGKRKTGRYIGGKCRCSYPRKPKRSGNRF